jgi:hypothetical protein
MLKKCFKKYSKIFLISFSNKEFTYILNKILPQESLYLSKSFSFKNNIKEYQKA